MGRPVKGPQLVEKLDGTEQDKHRLQVILETVAGTRPIDKAIAELGLSRSHFFTLRDRVLQAALSGLAPKPRGRPKAEPEPADVAAKVRELERLYEEQLLELRIANVREELRLVMPEVLVDADADARKKKARTMRNRRKRRSKRR